MINRHAALRVALPVVGTLFLLCSTVSAQPDQTDTRGLANPDQMSAGPMAAVDKEFQRAAAAYRVKIRSGEAVSGSASQVTVSAVALAGIEKYRAADFAKGVPIQLVIVKALGKSSVPTGSYLVRAQFTRGAASGSALFVDPAGTVVVRRPLIVTKWAQSGVLFPNVYPSPEPVDIPVITSVHVWHDGHWAVDCTGPGWNWVVIYY